MLALSDRLDSRLNALDAATARKSPSEGTREVFDSSEQNPAPVFLIRDAATDAGVHSRKQVQDQSAFQLDVISTGLVALPIAHSLLELSVFTPNYLFMAYKT